VRMAMAGLGEPATIWRWSFHYFMAVRREYLAITAPPEPVEDKNVVEIAPGITMETVQR
jgi:hypothetical protein